MTNALTRRRAVHLKTGGRCFYCGVDVSCFNEGLPRDWLAVRGGGLNMIPDHALARSRGGTDDHDNLLPACGACNSAKGAYTVDEFRCLKALRAANPSFTFACEAPAVIRDWLCVYSENAERELLLHSHPWARRN